MFAPRKIRENNDKKTNAINAPGHSFGCFLEIPLLLLFLFGLIHAIMHRRMIKASAKVVNVITEILPSYFHPVLLTMNIRMKRTSKIFAFRENLKPLPREKLLRFSGFLFPKDAC